MDSFTVIYHPSCDGWVLDLKAKLPHKLKASPSRSSGSDHRSSPAWSPSSKRGTPESSRPPALTRCWESIRRRIRKFGQCCRPCDSEVGQVRSSNRFEEKYSQMPSRDREEKIREAIIYCKMTMVKDVV